MIPYCISFYIGQTPSLNYFSNISQDTYNEYALEYNNNWNLRNETIKYCNLDCKVLYDILIKFNEFIFNLYKLT